MELDTLPPAVNTASPAAGAAAVAAAAAADDDDDGNDAYSPDLTVLISKKNREKYLLFHDDIYEFLRIDVVKRKKWIRLLVPKRHLHNLHSSVYLTQDE